MAFPLDRVERVKLGVFVLAGLTAGIAGLMAMGYYGAATSGDGRGYELNVIAAAVVGGLRLSGGEGILAIRSRAISFRNSDTLCLSKHSNCSHP